MPWRYIYLWQCIRNERQPKSGVWLDDLRGPSLVGGPHAFMKSWIRFYFASKVFHFCNHAFSTLKKNVFKISLKHMRFTD